MKFFVVLSVVFFVGACTPAAQNYKHYLAGKGLEEQRLYHFQHCHGYGCKFVSDVEFSEEDWEAIVAFFKPFPVNAEAERAALKEAVSLFERKVGALAGTSSDRGGTFYKIGDHQLDCVDESTNTTVYLALLQKRGLLLYHQIESPSVRLPLLHSGRWPHQSAVISEVETNKFFVVDSWFHDNGAPPEIVSLRAWKDGWRPE